MELLPHPSDLPIVIGGIGMRKTPALAGRDPEAVKISFVGPVVTAATDDEYRELLAAGAARKGMTVPEYEAFLMERNIPHGSPEQIAATANEFASMGVDRFSLQEYAALDAVDTTRLSDVFQALRG